MILKMTRNLSALLDTGARNVTIFGKSWRLHATDVLRVSAEDNLKLIESSVQYLVENGREVIYDAEHFLMVLQMTPNMLLKHYVPLRQVGRNALFFVILTEEGYP